MKKLTLISDHKIQLKTIRHIGEGLLQGMVSMHSKKIYHLDIKLENFLITQDGMVYVIDFGYSKELESPMISTSIKCDMTYRAPESLAHGRHLVCARDGTDPKTIYPGKECVEQYNAGLSDGWSVGITLLELILQTHPFSASKAQEFWEYSYQFFATHLDTHFKSEKFRSLETLDPLFCKVVRQLLQVKPEERMPVAEALAKLQAPSAFRFKNEEIGNAFRQLAEIENASTQTDFFKTTRDHNKNEDNNNPSRKHSL